MRPRRAGDGPGNPAAVPAVRANVMTNALFTLTLKADRVHVVSDGKTVGYVNLLEGHAIVLPLDQFVEAVRLALETRRGEPRKENV